MTEYLAAFAPEDLPDIRYSRVNEEQARFILAAMELPENQANFEVTLLPIGTAEERQAVADEWAGYDQAKGQVAARERGAILVVGSDRSPAYFLEVIDGKRDKITIPFAPFVAYAVSKIVKLNPEAEHYDLLRKYYESSED